MSPGQDVRHCGYREARWPGKRPNAKTSLLKELRDLTKRRFDLCQIYFESFKYDSFSDLNEFIVTTNHKDIIYIVGYIC